MVVRRVAALALLVGGTQTQGQVFDLPPPEDLKSLQHVGIWATHYYVYAATESDDGLLLLNLQGKQLGPRLSEADWCKGGIEGTIVVTLKTGAAATFNYAGRAQQPQAQAACEKYFKSPPSWVAGLNRTRYSATKYRFGTGAGGAPLVPYRSVAVDKDRIPLRSVLYIPSLRGTLLPLPDGGTATHDGYFFAIDTGGAIKEEHIDLFAGLHRKPLFEGVARKAPEGKPQPLSNAYLMRSGAVVERLEKEHAK